MDRDNRNNQKCVRKVMLVLLMLIATAVGAQNISVASFRMLENDLTANTHGTMERDQNGEVAALIKIVTSEQGFLFDGGMVGVVKTKQSVGEVWVYVPHGLKKITIQHQQLGVLRDYFFPLPIEKARTYEMVLTTGRVETVVTHAVSKQFVVFSVSPVDAVVELDDEVLEVDGEGVAQKLMPYGSYSYRVSCPNYHTDAGRVTVTAEGKAEKTVTLRANYGWIKVSGKSEYEGAYVYIDNERVGQLPYESKELKSGTHRVKVVKSMYKTYEQQVTVSDNETTELDVQLVANFANVTLTAGEGCEIWVDGQLQGNEQWSGPLQIGDYTVEVRKASHRNTSEIVRIGSSEARTIQLKSPTPIYTSLEISSTPSRAMVYIDGVEVGTTPLFKNDVLVGIRRIVFKKEGYTLVDKVVELQEGVENKVQAELSNANEVTITSNPAGADVYVDGKLEGVTPLKMTLTNGKHDLRFEKNNYNTENKVVFVDNQTTTISQNLSVVSQEVKITSSPSNADVVIDGMFKGVTPLDVTMGRGLHKISLSKYGYRSLTLYRNVPASNSDDFHFKLEKAKKVNVRPETNGNYRDASLYVDGYGSYALGNHRYALDAGWGVGFYLLGLNFEGGAGLASYLLGLNDDEEEAISSGASGFFRFGWGFKCGKNFLVTPQVGYVTTEFTRTNKDDYFYLQGYYEDKTYKSYTLGCRVQYCVNKFFALYVTPEYGFAPDQSKGSTFHVRAGLTLNLGL